MGQMAANSTMQGAGFIATIILAVLAASTLLAFMAWRVCKAAERAERDRRYLRRLLLWLGLLYAVGAVYGIAQIITGKAPVQTLIGLPIGGALAWYHLKAAARLKIPLGK